MRNTRKTLNPSQKTYRIKLKFFHIRHFVFVMNSLFIFDYIWHELLITYNDFPQTHILEKKKVYLYRYCTFSLYPTNSGHKSNKNREKGGGVIPVLFHIIQKNKIKYTTILKKCCIKYGTYYPRKIKNCIFRFFYILRTLQSRELAFYLDQWMCFHKLIWWASILGWYLYKDENRTLWVSREINNFYLFDIVLRIFSGDRNYDLFFLQWIILTYTSYNLE